MYWEEGATKVINQEVSSGLCTKLFSIDLPCLVNLADSDKHYPGILSYLVTLEGDEGPEMRQSLIIQSTLVNGQAIDNFITTKSFFILFMCEYLDIPSI
jgi:hypothetical protein